MRRKAAWAGPAVERDWQLRRLLAQPPSLVLKTSPSRPVTPALAVKPS